MILPFSTQINGRPSYFIEKIWDGILQAEELDAVADEYQYFRCLHRTRFGKNWDDMSNLEIAPKIHTIREDVNDRWHAGRAIHFTINNRSKNSFRFAPVLPCVSTQEVFMSMRNESLEISVDDKYLYHQNKLMLAKQDGFDTLEEFEQYFIEAIEKKPRECATFKLIHWTNFKY